MEGSLRTPVLLLKACTEVRHSVTAAAAVAAATTTTVAIGVAVAATMRKKRQQLEPKQASGDKISRRELRSSERR
jgi:hypothetical protein